MIIQDVINELEHHAPKFFQESYDNCGLIIGNADEKVKGVLLSLDCTETVINEAIELNCNLIVSHHPLIFSGLKKITGTNYVERTVQKAIRNNISIYAAHTNFDNIIEGVNLKIAEKLGLTDCHVLAPKNTSLQKLITFVPIEHHYKVREALFNAGAGKIGNYDSCSFNLEGFGTYRGNENSNPVYGEKGKMHQEQEIRIEVIFEKPRQNSIVKALIDSHPYEVVAYDILTLDNKNEHHGSGMVGVYTNSIAELEFLEKIKHTFNCKVLKHTKLLGKPIKKVAFCGGSGSFLINNAINSKSDVYITSDVKYHDFFDADGKILLVDTGHFENEQFTPEIFYQLIKKKFSTFATYLSKENTNPVNYF